MDPLDILREALETAARRLDVYAEWCERQIIASRGTDLLREIRKGCQADAARARAALAAMEGR